MAKIIQFPLNRVQTFTEPTIVEFDADTETKLTELEAGAQEVQRDSNRAIKDALSLLGDVISIDYTQPGFEPDDIA